MSFDEIFPFHFIVTGFFSKLIKFFVSVAINVLSSNNHLFYDKKKSFTKQLIRTFSTTIEHMCRNACIIQSIVGNVVIILRQHIVFLVVLTKSIELQLLFGIQCWNRMKFGLPFDHRSSKELVRIHFKSLINEHTSHTYDTTQNLM